MSASSTGLKIPFGYKNGRYYGPKEVPNGDKCGCFCPGCEQLLRANQGSEKSTRRAYFSHQVKGECVNGYETAVHRYAKQIIADELSVLLPEFRVKGETFDYPVPGSASYSFRSEDFVAEERLGEFTRAEVEKSVHPYRPDITLHRDDCTLYVEVCVTNPVSEEKAEFFKDSNLLEIYLKGLDSDVVFDSEEFKKTVVENAHRKWIHCNLFNTELEEHRELQEKQSIDGYQKYLEKLRREQAAHTKKLEAQRQAREEEQRKKEQIERNKLQQRAAYQKELEELEHFYAPGVLEARREALLREAQQSIEAIKQHFNHDGQIPTQLTLEPEGGWVFKTHWIVWQSYVFVKYIQQAELGSKLYAYRIKDIVVDRYHVLESMVTLNNIKQQQKKQGKQRGEYYGSKGAWFFSDDENRKIISPYKPVIHFLKSLESVGVLQRDDPQLDIFTIKQNCIETAYKILQERYEAQQAAMKHRYLKQQEAWEKRRAEEEAERKRRNEQSIAHQEKRIQEISRRVRELFDSGFKLAQKCTFCASVFEPNTSSCTSCGKSDFEKLELTVEYVETVEFRLRCDPRIKNIK